VAQAGKANDLKGLTRSHRRTYNDFVPKSREVLFASTERITALGLGLRAVSCLRLGRNPPREPDRLGRLPILDFNLDFTDWFA
jgi:hypothetical protein